MRENEDGLDASRCPKCNLTFRHRPGYAGLCGICFDNGFTVDDTSAYANMPMTKNSTQPVSGGASWRNRHNQFGDTMGNGILKDQTLPYRGRN